MKHLSVLSFGSTRGLWEGANAEDTRRMLAYAEHLDAYIIVTNSYKKHRLRPRQLLAHVEAIPTNAFGPADSLLRMLGIGIARLRERRVSLIQAQDPLFLGLIAIVLGKLFSLPVNVCVYGENVFDKNWLRSHWSHRWLAPLGRWVLARSQGVQTDGKMTVRGLIAGGIPAENIALKPVVPANLGSFFAIEREERAADAPVRILFVGRFAAAKNLPLLLTALAEMKKDGATGFVAGLVGEGPEESQLRAQVETQDLAGIVNFHGPLPRERIAEAFADADVFVLSSDYEGYPRVLMEAAAAALPIVSTQVSGADEAVRDGESGFLVPVGDAKMLAAKIHALISDGELRRRMGAAAREHIRTQLDPRTNTPGQVAIWKRVAHPPLVLPRRLLLFNLVTDSAHPILGFTTLWIRELAARVESIDVVTMQSGVIDVPENVRVHSVGKERGFSEPRRLLEFYRLLFGILRTRRIDGCFSHMIQLFSVLAGPVLRARGIPLVTWYAHPKLNPMLKLAHIVSNRMVTSLPSAYPHRHDKLTVIGQGIDTTLFRAIDPAAAQENLLLCVGRISPVKNHPTLLRALALLPEMVRLEIVGITAGAADEAYAAELRALVAELHLENRVAFLPPVPPAQLPAIYGRCAAHVNLTPAGFGDKVAWEAMSCGRPCLVANSEFRETLGAHADTLLFRENDPVDLAAKLTAVLALSPAERASIGLDLRAQVQQLHALPRLAERILNLLQRSSQ